MRIDQIHSALSEEPLRVPEIAGKIYGRQVDSRLQPLCERTTRAALEYRVEHSRARRVAEDLYASG